MASELSSVFAKLRQILELHAHDFPISRATARHYELEATVGAATLQAWGGKQKRPRIPVAWVSIEKSYVSYHLMGLAHPRVRGSLSSRLADRMQGKTCFNFKAEDPELLKELEAATAMSLASLRDEGFIA